MVGNLSIAARATSLDVRYISTQGGGGQSGAGAARACQRATLGQKRGSLCARRLARGCPTSTLKGDRMVGNADGKDTAIKHKGNISREKDRSRAFCL